MDMNITSFLPVVAAVHGQRPAVSVGSRLFCNYAGLHDRVRSLAASYGARFGLEKGDRVAVAMRNSPQYFEILLACWDVESGKQRIGRRHLDACERTLRRFFAK